METLTAALDDALSGRGRMVMLAGEHGIEKTRLAQELAAYAQMQSVRCYGAGDRLKGGIDGVNEKMIDGALTRRE